jgi:hypothetical protein
LTVPIRKRPDGTWLKTHYDCWRFMSMDFSDFCVYAMAMDGPACIEAMLSVEDLLYRLPWTISVDWHLCYAPMTETNRHSQSNLPPRPDRLRRPIGGNITGHKWPHKPRFKLWLFPDPQAPIYEQSGGQDITYGELTWETLAVEVERRQREAEADQDGRA